jgi:hypothetical protein
LHPCDAGNGRGVTLPVWLLASLLLSACAAPDAQAPGESEDREALAPATATGGEPTAESVEDILASLEAVQWEEADIVDRLGLQPGDREGTYVYELDDGTRCPVLVVLTSAIHVALHRQDGNKLVVSNPDATAGLLLRTEPEPEREHELDPAEDVPWPDTRCRYALEEALEGLRVPG